MLKKILLLFISIILIMGVYGSVMAADKETYTYTSTINGVEAEWTYKLNDSSEIIELKCTNPSELTGDITIPSTINGKNVVSIGDGAFAYAANITGVTMPDTLKRIEYNAFENCTKLEKVDLGKIEGISFGVFGGCTSLKSITIPKTLKSGPISPVFIDCTNLTNITFEEGLTVIVKNLCATTPITEITIPDSVKTIEYNAFQDCTKLEKVDLGKIEEISFSVFGGCTSLKSITIPKTLKSGPVSPVFSNCTNLTKITLEEGLTIIPKNLCATTPITEITIPDSVKTIEYNAFQDCTKLEKVDLGKIEEISFDVFGGCTSLKSITIPKTLKSGPVSPVFTNCTNLTKITLEDGLTIIPKNLFATTPITEITIPNSVKSIEYDAFEDCTQLKKITILDNVTDMGFYNISDNDSIFQNHNKDLTIYCYKDSMAAKYAIKYDIKYVYLQKPITDDVEDKEDEEENNTNKGTTSKDNTTSNTILPHTGGSVIAVVSFIILVSFSVIMYKKYNSYKDVK